MTHYTGDFGSTTINELQVCMTCISATYVYIDDLHFCYVYIDDLLPTKLWYGMRQNKVPVLCLYNLRKTHSCRNITNKHTPFGTRNYGTVIDRHCWSSVIQCSIISPITTQANKQLHQLVQGLI